MLKILVIFSYIIVSASTSCTCNSSNTMNFITRDKWGASEPTNVTNFQEPPTYVIIHHSESPKYCSEEEDCKKRVKSIQSYHMNDRGWDDIGYNFLIGGDENIYYGRGFNVVGAHASNYNNRSMGICLIGNYQSEPPPTEMLTATQKLISYAVANGYLSPNYKLLGHRQVRSTDCPGDSLFEIIKTWPNFSNKP